MQSAARPSGLPRLAPEMHPTLLMKYFILFTLIQAIALADCLTGSGTQTFLKNNQKNLEEIAKLRKILEGFPSPLRHWEKGHIKGSLVAPSEGVIAAQKAWETEMSEAVADPQVARILRWGDVTIPRNFVGDTLAFRSEVARLIREKESGLLGGFRASLEGDGVKLPYDEKTSCKLKPALDEATKAVTKVGFECYDPDRVSGCPVLSIPLENGPAEFCDFKLPSSVSPVPTLEELDQFTLNRVLLAGQAPDRFRASGNLTKYDYKVKNPPPHWKVQFPKADGYVARMIFQRNKLAVWGDHCLGKENKGQPIQDDGSAVTGPSHFGKIKK